MSRAPSSKYSWLGPDNLDKDAKVVGGLSKGAKEVAEDAMALLLACARRIVFFDRQVRQQKWEVIQTVLSVFTK
jgi:lactate dehydrogenase-like 2-hydroxyacid dehydrogenase